MPQHLHTQEQSMCFFLYKRLRQVNEVTGDERITIHEDLSAILDVSSGWMYDDLLRQIGWGIIKFLVWLNDWIEGVATKIITLGGLYNSPDMKEFMEMM